MKWAFGHVLRVGPRRGGSGRVAPALLPRLACGILLVVMLGACGKPNKNVFATSNASVGNGTADASLGFSVALKVDPTDGTPRFLHRFDSINQPCRVTAAESPKRIDCLLHMQEYDLFYSGWTVNMNVPPGMCPFIERDVYSYYNYRPGTGPVTTTITLDSSGAMTACTMDGQNVLSGGQCVGQEATVSPSGSVSCNYDYSTTDNPDRPNCCTTPDSASIAITTVSSAGNTTNTITPTYGGRHANCLGGHGVTSEEWPKQNGIPSTLISSVPSVGASFELKVDGAREGFGNSTATTAYSANFFGWSTYLSNGSGWYAAAVESAGAANLIPRGMRPTADRGPTNDNLGNSIRDGNLYYGWRCVNNAGETLNEIRLWVNEWNTKEDYESFVSTGSSAADPHKIGTVGVTCSSANGLPGQYCNSFWDWDELIDSVGANPVDAFTDGADAAATSDGRTNRWVFPRDPQRQYPTN